MSDVPMRDRVRNAIITRMLNQSKLDVTSRVKASFTQLRWKSLWDGWCWDKLEPVEVARWTILVCTKTKQY